MEPYERFHTIADIRNCNREYAAASGRAYWFAPDTMRFFGTTIEGDIRPVSIGAFFVTSETPSYEKQPRYTLRLAHLDGQIETVGSKFHHYETAQAAWNAADSAMDYLP